MERVAWARAHMPLLRELEAELARTRPFAGMTIGICLHVEPKTAVLATALAQGGASVAITGSPGTTQNDVADWLASQGFEVHGRREDGLLEHRQNLSRVMERRPELLLDNGADLVSLLLEQGGKAIGATEETTTGANRLREELPGRVSFPVIVINDSPLKSIVENQHGVGQTVTSSFLHATNLGVAGRRFAVLGFGWCGRGIARSLSALGGRVAVVEPDSIRALEAALEGFDVSSLEEAIPRSEVFITATGRPGVLRREHFELLPEGAVLANSGHFSTEIELDALRAASRETARVDGGIERFTLASGKTIYLLARGEMLNLAAGGGNPVEVMDLGLSLQAASLARIARDPSTLAAGPQPVPADINQAVARQMLASLRQ
ncbi:MAG TPA: adenosylhomocysteinase [Vicinamibacteria bacterium]|nr:adenosylhomocysteinase [Vicinamibacteria bacterium]